MSRETDSLDRNELISDDEMKSLLESTAPNLQDDPLVLHFRCKYSLRKQLPDSMDFDQTQRDRITLELERVERLRSCFTSRNGPLISKLAASRKIWTNEAKHNCKKTIETVQMQLAEAVASRSRALSPEEVALAAQQKQRYERELKILSKFNAWESEPPSQSDAVEEKAYNLMVKSIILKRDSSRRETGLSSYRYQKEYKRRSPLSLYDFLYSDRAEVNPLVSKCDKDTIQYFHVPANNMIWVEEVMARYYGEKRGDYNYRKAKNYCKRSSNLLCREFWTAQQHGGNTDPVHARHMRAHASYIPSEELEILPDGLPPDSSSQTRTTRNFVIFMPYLHWETDKRRRKLADVVKQSTEENSMTDPGEKFLDTVEEFRAKFGPRIHTEPFEKVPLPERRSRSSLGEYLFNVAQVYEAMDIDADIRVLRDYLHETPPLHARRTLDQSYHSKLEDTGRRDEDQVVYRGTHAGDRIDKTTRVTMVDQLWLYILDDRTIISFFPRRWGRNKPDFSGVHKCVQSKLEHLRPGEIHSVHDLALIIMNQCSTVFFDRTRPADGRPQVLDIFANAIAQVSEKKSIAFERFWKHLRKLNPEGVLQMRTEDMEEAARIYLNVNPEGMLLREAHDIMDEVRMMSRIYDQQLHVARHFSKALLDLSDGGEPLTAKQRLQNANTTSRQYRAEVTGRSNGNIPEVDQTRYEVIADGTLDRATNLVEDIKSRIQELVDLKESTLEITEHLKDLLDLKQQQAGIIEAKAALARADEGIKQGRAIMMFTVVTIIFLPLSFMSSVFGMNAKELSGPDGGVMSIKHQFKFMFSISFGIIVVSLALAFGTWIRAAILLLGSLTWASCAEYTGIRAVWLKCTNGYDAKKLYKTDRDMTAKIYGRRKKKEMRRYKDAAKVVEEMIRSRKAGVAVNSKAYGRIRKGNENECEMV